MLKSYVNQERYFSAKKLRKILMKQHPYCFYCHRKVRDDYPHYNRNLKRGELFPDDAATIEHLYSRLDPENRYKVYPNNQNKVLACYKCNHRLGNKESHSLSVEEQKKRNNLGEWRKRNNPTISRPELFYGIK